MLRKQFYIIICLITFFATATTSVLAQTQLVTNWYKTDYSQARVHILQADEQKINLAVEIKIIENYKTYWRSPGSTGVPPLAAIKGQNIDPASAEIQFPHPHKYINKYGETWGYKDKAVLFLNVNRINAAKNSKLKIQFDYAVCDVICLPEHAEFSLILDGGNVARTMSAIKFSKYHKQISQSVKLSDSAIKTASLTANNMLKLALNLPLDGDIFITDSKNRFYQHASTNVNQRTFNIHGLPRDENNKNQPLKVYYYTDKGYFHTEIELQ